MIECVFSDVKNSPIYQAIVTELLRSGVDLRITVLSSEKNLFADWVEASGCPVSRRLVLRRIDLVNHWLGLRWRFVRSKPALVVCFGQQATLLGLSASFGLGATCRIYARYHSTTHLETSNRRGMFYDRVSNRLADLVVAPNENVARALCDTEGFDRECVKIIPFGFDLADFAEPGDSRISEVRQRWGIDESKITVGMISRLTGVKGWRYVVGPLASRLEADPDLRLVVANAIGELHDEIELGFSHVENQVTLIDYESDVAALYGTFDVFVHVPTSPTVEAFGLVYIEAFAAGVPAVITVSGIADEFAEDQSNCLVVPHMDGDAIGVALDELLTSGTERARLGAAAQRSVAGFDIEVMAVAYRDLLVDQAQPKA